MDMENTLFLAQFLGLFSIIFSVAIIMRRKMIVHVLRDFLKDRTLAFVVGVFEMAAGLLLVLNLSSWNGTLEIVISLLGWAFLLEGIFYLFARQKTMQKLISALDNVSAYYFFALLYLFLGIYLVLAGFGMGSWA